MKGSDSTDHQKLNSFNMYNNNNKSLQMKWKVRRISSGDSSQDLDAHKQSQTSSDWLDVEEKIMESSLF